MAFVIDTSAPSAETQKIAAEELRETPENVAAGLKELKDLLAADTSITYDTSDDFLMIFLRPTKFYAKSAYELMKRIADFKKKHYELFGELSPEMEKDVFMNTDVLNIFPNRDHKGRRILMVKMGGNWKPSEISTDQILKILYMLHLAAMLEPETQIRGAVVIMDYKDMGMKQVTAVSPGFAMKLMTFIQEAMPLRLKEIHMVNNPMLFNMVWKIIKPLVKEKLNKRIHFHGSKMDSLHGFIPPSHLPEDYGGQLPKINYGGKDWYPAVEGHLAHFERWRKCGKN
ncbi:alpha-tocopherol transfer protein-like [Onthophagus taurus]|uniref:alpha-tocopherol transfer protein-like n=1 Tax=Onthophagus taurus TaxID=166361 RepID=UPI000C20CCFC|nr:alpha-tocopherol transfer protein-like [Onthophagus taurus]